MLSAESLKKIDREIAKYPPDQKQSAVMAALVIAQDVAPDYLQQRIQRLSRLGYWQDPGESPNARMVALSDAVTACMADEACW